MIYALLSDIHANASALRKVMADAWKEGATQIVCLGDVVGYGPEPARSVAMLRVEKATVIAGNHDDAVSGRIDASNFTDFAADAVCRHRAALRDDEKDWLAALPYIANIDGDAVCVHGDLTAPREFRYIESTADAAANFAVCANSLIFVGHTHVPGIFITGKSGKTYKTAPQDFTVEQGKRYIVNVGTIGYPREENGVCLSSYVLYDSDRREVRFRFLPFSVASVMQRGPAKAIQPAAPTSATPPARVAPDPIARRERRIALAALLTLIAIFAVTLFFAMRSRTAAPTTSTGVVKGVEPAKIETPDPSQTVKRVILLHGREKSIRPNLALTKKSSPVTLTINFLNQAGAVISSKEEYIKESKTKGYRIPPNTHRVEFIVAPAKTGEPISISRFSPSAE